MATRKFLVFSTKTNDLQTVETQASTWGEFKQELIDAGLYLPDSMTAFLKETSQDLVDGSISLPIGLGKDTEGNNNGTDGTIILNISKTKAGI